MFQNSTTETKLALLEERLSVYEQMMRKIESAIEKIGETSQNISKMLAIHDEKIDQHGKTDNSLSKLIYEMREESEANCKKVSARIDKLDEEVEEIGKIKWMTVGCGVLLAVLTTAFSTLASGWWTPSEMQMQHEGHLNQHNVQD
jgi:mevalonate kinase